MLHHTYRIIIDPDEKGFHGYVPALRGCHTWGATIPETIKHLHEAIELYLESLRDQGEEIPTEKSFETFATVQLKARSAKRQKQKIKN